ncbi:LysR substrate-binding domain-containing protein [Photobacterium aphoticum]|uniref:LysR family transcriptional regulator n=1 Tax=Photobacterium aphoticum TaxID=754436 RepID=A0A0J1JBK1_9GAMM|nr:LysR substrate-binding domain-containing protein [Photobacterium aphoticum]KLU98971.1 LysR family transcriptional regulator [Photobacterium aphoticum]PSU45616.1 LysR family transcriptional regulator [Photobacterium aphoticum]GHA57022.1 LysR family transcriptional regulator [Photobacterium aphoticum]
MNTINWRGVDLNLLIAFSALMETRSVTKAAAKLSMGQSAMSHNLSRLRTLIDDPLFERHGHQMIATDKALELAPVVEHILQLVTSEILQPGDFSPAHYQGIFRIGLTDYAELLFAPALFDAIQQHAPHSQLSFCNVDRNNYQQAAEAQQIDVIIGSMKDLPREFDSQYLYTEDHVCLFDSTATGLSTPIDLARYIQTPQALVTPDGKLASNVDNQLQQQGFQRHIAVGSSSFLTIRHLLTGRNLLCVVSTLMAKLDVFQDTLTQCRPPVDIPDFDINMLWLRRNATHPRQEWLRQCVHQTITARVNELRQLN